MSENKENKTHNISDPLLECVLIIASAHGIALSRDMARAGLPLENDRLGPDLLDRVAKRGNMSCRLARQSLTQINRSLLPAILILEEGNACVLIDIDCDNNQAGVIFPELGESRIELSLDDLNQKYTDSLAYLQPKYHFDARSPSVGAVRRRHWFWSVIAENKALYRDVLIAAFMMSIFALAMPLFIRIVYDRVIPNQAVHTLWALAAGVAIVILGDLVLRTMRGYFLDVASKRVDVKLSGSIMEKVLGTRLEYRPLSAGSFASNLRSFETVRDFITSTTITAFIDLPFSLVFIFVIGLIAWQMTIPIIVGMFVAILIALSVQGQMHELSETTYRAAAQRNATLIESLVGLETLKALGAESRMQTRWEQSVAFLAQISNRLRLLSTATLNTALWVSQSVNVVLIIVGVYLMMDNRLSLGGLIACSMLSSRALAPISQVAGLMTQYHHATTAFNSLNQIMANPVERPEESNFLSRSQLQGAIDFNNVSFSYPNQEMTVLKDISLRLAPGEKVAILGRVGSGKSTLLKMILGLFLPSEGAICIDGIDSRQIDPAELRRACGYVPQDPGLFYGTLKENLTLGASGVDDSAIATAAKFGALEEFVNSHPQGYDMMIGERGESLSGGQRQGVAIARALVKEPRLLLLDEPTGSMDHTSEELVKQQLRNIDPQTSVLLVTHRTSLLDMAERIVVLDSGRIVADGPREKVLEDLRQGRIGRAL